MTRKRRTSSKPHFMPQSNTIWQKATLCLSLASCALLGTIMLIVHELGNADVYHANIQHAAHGTERFRRVMATPETTLYNLQYLILAIFLVGLVATLLSHYQESLQRETQPSRRHPRTTFRARRREAPRRLR